MVTTTESVAAGDRAKLIHAGQAIVDALGRHGVKRVFSVPGESFLPVLDALYDCGIDNVVCRQEGGAGYMAEAHGKLTGEPGVALVTRGPGAANACIAVHAAWQDATPMVMFVGLIGVRQRQREAFQEFDPQAWFGTQTKRVLILDAPERAAEIVTEAFFAACAGRPGPVIVGLPEDVLYQKTACCTQQVRIVAEGAVSEAELAHIRETLRDACRPLLYVGGSRWTRRAVAGITQFAEINGIPVVHDWRATDRVPFDSPANAGWLGYGRADSAAQLLADADVLVAVGALLTDVPTDGYTLRQSADAANVIVNIDTALRGHSGAVTQHVLAAPRVFADVVRCVNLHRQGQWHDWFQQARENQLNAARIPEADGLPPTVRGTAHVAEVFREVVSILPDDSIYTFGAGQHCLWAQQYLPTRHFPSQLSVRNGSMGYSVPAAVAAALEYPCRFVLAIAGDGEFGMNGQELATAVQYRAPMLVIVLDNGQFGTIRSHQEYYFPGRVSGTQLRNPDMVTLMEGYGGYGERVAADDQIAGAIGRAVAFVNDNRRPALVQVMVDQQLDTP